MADIEYHEGDYMAEVTEQAWQWSSNKNRMLVLSVYPKTACVQRSNGMGGLIEEQVPVERSLKRTIRLTIASDKQAEVVLSKLRANGFKGQKWSEVNLTGSMVRCTVEADTYNNKPTERWDLAMPGRGPLQGDDSIAASLDTDFPLTGAVAIGGGGSVPVAAAAGGGADDDDIPFAVALPLLLPALWSLLSTSV